MPEDHVTDSVVRRVSPGERLRLGVLLSGGGRTLGNLLDEIEAGRLPGSVAVVIGTSPSAGGLAIAREAGIDAHVADVGRLSPDAFHERVAELLIDANVDLVCMAGLMHFWEIPERYTGRVMNIHPALLPRFGGRGFYGMRVHRAVLEAGARESGCTVHFADNEYDHGPIILQRTMPVLPDDTPEMLAARVFEEERIAYPEAIRLYAAGRLRLHDGKVTVLSS